MSTEVVAGDYLGRRIVVVANDGGNRKVGSSLLSEASVLFWIANEADLSKFLSCLPWVVSESPLVLFPGGNFAEEAFSFLLEFLSRESLTVQIMTRYNDGGLCECIEDFLQACWPSEDRWNEWHKYVVVGGEGEIDHILEAVAATI